MDVMREGPHINVTDGLSSSKARIEQIIAIQTLVC